MQIKDNSISVLVVEDHQITMAGLKLTLQQEKKFHVVGDASNGRSAVDKALQLRPSVILMDIGLPHMDGLEATWQIKQALPASRVIMLTSHDRDEDISAALGVGADGYCFKDISADELLRGINLVTSGSSWLDPRILQRMQSSYSGEPAKTKEIIRILCNRELEILRLLEQGFDSGAIAKRLSVQVELVNMYKINIMEKLFRDNSQIGDLSGEHLRNAKYEIRPLPLIDGDIAVQTAHEVDESHGKERGAGLQVSFPSMDDLSPSSVAEGLTVGTIFAQRYVVESFIGEGGMGLVYRAKHLHMNRLVAIKVLHSRLMEDRHLLRRFQQESMTASTLNHPNVVSIYDFGISPEGKQFLIMDYLDGYGLNDVLSKEVYLSLDRFLGIFTQVCDGLAAAHAKNVIHCDLKPSNIMLTKEEGESEFVKIVDFGLSVILPRDPGVQSQLTDSFEVYGSPCYMSPEQCAGSKLDARSDVYALGCAMYEAITGKTVFSAKNPFELFAKHLRQMPERFAVVCPDRSIPYFLEKIIFKALAKEPADRYQSVNDLKADLVRMVRQSIL